MNTLGGTVAIPWALCAECGRVWKVYLDPERTYRVRAHDIWPGELCPGSRRQPVPGTLGPIETKPRTCMTPGCTNPVLVRRHRFCEDCNRQYMEDAGSRDHRKPML